MQNRKQEENCSSTQPLTLTSLLGGNDYKFGAGKFILEAKGVSFRRPLSFLGVGNTPSKELNIKKNVINVENPNLRKIEQVPVIEFHFSPPGQSYPGKQEQIIFYEKDVVDALSKPELLPDGRMGVYLSKPVLFNRLCETGGLAMTFSLFLGSGYGKQNIAMIFQDHKLEDINITENYHGDRVLFTAKNLISCELLYQHVHEERQSQLNEEEQIKKTNRFNF